MPFKRTVGRKTMYAMLQSHCLACRMTCKSVSGHVTRQVRGPPPAPVLQLCSDLISCSHADGQGQYIDLQPHMAALPLLERRSEHNPAVDPRDVYRGLEYSWHGLYALALSPSDFPGMQLQVPAPRPVEASTHFTRCTCHCRAAALAVPCEAPERAVQCLHSTV